MPGLKKAREAKESASAELVKVWRREELDESNICIVSVRIRIVMPALQIITGLHQCTKSIMNVVSNTIANRHVPDLVDELDDA